MSLKTTNIIGGHLFGRLRLGLVRERRFSGFGLMLARLGQPMKAEKWFKKSIQLEKDFLYAHVALIQMPLAKKEKNTSTES